MSDDKTITISRQLYRLLHEQRDTLRAALLDACDVADDLNSDNGDYEELERRRAQIAGLRRKAEGT